MYRVELDEQAREQIDALPDDAVVAFAELRVMLETAPWDGGRSTGTTRTRRCVPMRSAPEA